MDDRKLIEKSGPGLAEAQATVPAPEELDTTARVNDPPVLAPRRKRQRTEKPFYISIASLGALIVILFIFSVFGPRNTAQPVDTGGSVEPEASPSETTPMLSTGITSSSGAEILIPDLYEGLEMNGLDTENFYIAANGFLTYSDGGITSYAGIDVSEHQAEIDWDAVTASGVDFAMIRVGYRGYTAGTISADPYFQQNIEGALAAGIKVGVYFFSQAVTTEEAVEEADFVLSLIDGYDVSYPIAFDWELVQDESARTNELTSEELTACTIAFCDRISEAGYQPIIYFNQMAGYTHFLLTDLNHYDFWLAEYNQTPNFLFSFHMWQYSSTGTVDGINEPVDLNISFVDYSNR